MDLSKFEPLMEDFIKVGVPGCALSVSHNGEVVFKKYKGFADIEQKQLVDEKTVYRMFSATKVITIAAALILYDRGLILLNDPVEKYLPFFADAKYCFIDGSNSLHVVPVSRSIRIKDLMTMTSGLVMGGEGSFTHNELAKLGRFGPTQPLTTMEYIEQISKVPLAFDPGTHWNYGLGLDVLGAVIEAVTGMTFGEFLSKEIFQPLQMNQTSFFLTEALSKHFATLYFSENGKLSKSTVMDGMYDAANKYEGGGGGLLSTLDDMTQFTRMLSMGGSLDGERILGYKSIDLMRQNHLEGSPLADFRKISEDSWPWFEGYGYGLGVRTLMSRTASGSNGSVGEFGWVGAAGTWLMIDVDEKLAVCYMQQILPIEESFQDYCDPRIRNVVYGALD